MRRLIGLIAWPVQAFVGWLYGVLRPGNPYGLDSHEDTKDTEKNDDGTRDGH